MGTSGVALYPSPGLAVADNLGATAILGQYMCQPGGASGDRHFVVVQNGVNQILYERFANSAPVVRGTLNAPTTANPTFADNGTQLVICTGGQLWLFDMSTNAAPIQVAGSLAVSIGQIEYSGGFFVAVQAESNTMYVSALLDGTTWPTLGKAIISDFPDNIVSVIVNQGVLYIFGRKQSVPYSNVGALNFPFLPVQGAQVEIGCGAASSVVRLDNSVFWLDADERGGTIARKVSGLTPQRVSNHGVEHIWQSYPTTSDAISYAFQMNGHSLWHIHFPSGTSVDGIPGVGASWRYDVENQSWHEVAFWNEALGHYEAHHSRNHAYAFGKHFVGDWKSGNIYQMANPVMTVGKDGSRKWSFADDAGSPIRRMRRGPTISTENQYFDIPQIEFDVEVGLGPSPALTGSQPPTLLTLADASGSVSTVGVNDAGALTSTPGSVSSAQTVILNDPTNSTSWKLGIEAGGPRGIVQLQAAGNYPTSLKMISASGTKIYLLQISIAGILQTVGGGNVVRGPQLMFRWSKDHAHTWTDYEQLDCGQSGEYRKRVIRRRIGRLRAFTPEVTWTDPGPLRIVDAYIPPPTERLAKQMAKMA